MKTEEEIFEQCFRSGMINKDFEAFKQTHPALLKCILDAMRQVSNLNKDDVIYPCPYCGGKAEINLWGNAVSKNRSAEIKCGKCNVKMIVAAMYQSLEWCEKTVIEKWNRRVGK